MKNVCTKVNNESFFIFKLLLTATPVILIQIMHMNITTKNAELYASLISSQKLRKYLINNL